MADDHSSMADIKSEKKQVTMSAATLDECDKFTLKHQNSLSRIGRLKLESVTQYSDISSSSPTPVNRTHPLPGAMRFRDLSRRALFITSRLFAGGQGGGTGSGGGGVAGLGRGQRLDIMSSNSSFAGRNRGPSYENTYRLQPEPDKSFNAVRVQRIIVETLEELLPENQTYEPAQCAQLCMKISEVIRSRTRTVAQLVMPRYKWVCQVMVGAKQSQTVRLASRCLWDPATDNYQCVRFENQHLFAVAILHGVYCE